MRVSPYGVVLVLVIALGFLALATATLPLVHVLIGAPLVFGLAYAVPHDIALARFNRESAEKRTPVAA